jgi:fructokinase
MSIPTIICFGEVLWDLLPTGKIAGGAPMNVAFHANQLGMRSHMISRIGHDSLGSELLAFLDEKGVSTRLVQTDETFPTGIVNVVLDEKGSPSYDIVQPAAWDFIHPVTEMTDTVKEADALIFGSLACRNERTKRTLFELLDIAPLRVLDVNLRAPFYSKTLLEELLQKADLVKMNDEELHLISGYWSQLEGEQLQMSFLKEKFRLEAIIVTKGSKGAVCLDETGFYEQAGFQVTVKDTIGSGDAFLAAFLSKLLVNENAAECLRFACAIGALAATKSGGTALMSEAEINAILESKILTNS